MRKVSDWFKKELRIIDPAYFVMEDEETQTFDICLMKDHEEINGVKRKVPKHIRIVASFKHLNDAALNELRFRKWLGRKMELDRHPDRMYQKIHRDRERKKAEGREERIERMAEGYMRIHNWGRTKMFT